MIAYNEQLIHFSVFFFLMFSYIFFPLGHGKMAVSSEIIVGFEVTTLKQKLVCMFRCDVLAWIIFSLWKGVQKCAHMRNHGYTEPIYVAKCSGTTELLCTHIYRENSGSFVYCCLFCVNICSTRNTLCTLLIQINSN